MRHQAKDEACAVRDPCDGARGAVGIFGVMHGGDSAGINVFEYDSGVGISRGAHHRPAFTVGRGHIQNLAGKAFRPNAFFVGHPHPDLTVFETRGLIFNQRHGSFTGSA